MKKKTDSNFSENQKEKNIETAFRTGGFLFPETIDEVKEFERIYGKTDVILPMSLQYPTFLDKSSSANNLRSISFELDNFAMAARSENSSALPQSLLKAMENHRNEFDSKKKIKKK